MTAAEITARLVKINAAIDYLLNGNAQSLSIAGRVWTGLSINELEDLRAKYELELRAVEAGGARPHVIRFGRAS